VAKVIGRWAARLATISAGADEGEVVWAQELLDAAGAQRPVGAR